MPANSGWDLIQRLKR